MAHLLHLFIVIGDQAHNEDFSFAFCAWNNGLDCSFIRTKVDRTIRGEFREKDNLTPQHVQKIIETGLR